MRTMICAAILTLGGLLNADEIKIVGDEWAPYTNNPSSGKNGFMIDIAKAVFEKNGIKVQYSVVPWTRALQEAQAGSFDAIAGSSKSPDRLFHWPTEPQGVARPTFFTMKDSTWEYKDASSLKGITLGAVQDFSYFEALNKFLESKPKNVELIPSQEGYLDSLIQLLQKKRVDVIIEDAAVVRSKIKEMGLKQEDFREVVVPGSDDPVFVAFSTKTPKGKEYAQMMSEGMQKLRESGELQKILDAYGLKDWK